jgi:hypothetical protein
MKIHNITEGYSYISDSNPQPEQKVVDKFARVADSQRSYYIMKWAEEKGMDTDDAMHKAGYVKDGYLGAGAYNWRYVGMGESVEEANNPDAGEYTYTLELNGESQGYTTHTLTITSPEGESKVVADDFTYFEVEGDELQAELHSWFNMGHGVGDEGLGEADGPEDQEESFDPAMEPSHYDSEFERMYAAYENGGEPELAEFLGMSDRELDQEMTEYAMDHNLHMDDDRDEVIQGYLEQLIDNADHKDMGAQMAQYESQLVQLKKLAGI